jgi:hypothetical protein
MVCVEAYHVEEKEEEQENALTRSITKRERQSVHGKFDQPGRKVSF